MLDDLTTYGPSVAVLLAVIAMLIREWKPKTPPLNCLFSEETKLGISKAKALAILAARDSELLHRNNRLLVANNRMLFALLKHDPVLRDQAERIE